MQDEVQENSSKDPERFWKHQAEQLFWHKKPTHALRQTTKSLSSGVSHPHWTWFPDGEISTSYNCVDRHVKGGHGESTAIIWDSPVTGSKEKYTYVELLHEVQTLAGVLKEEGVKKGDVVLVYSVCQAGFLVELRLTSQSANDSSCALWAPCNCTSRRHPRCCIWWLLSTIASSTYRGVQSTVHLNSVVWC